MPAWGKVMDAVSQLLLPRRCAACSSQEDVQAGFCSPCSSQLLGLVSLEYCPRCGSSLGPGLEVRQDGCSGCPDVMPRFDRVVRVGPYAEPLRSAIQSMKYRAQTGASDVLGELLAQAVMGQLRAEDYDLIQPVPMFWLRRILRGANHADLLAHRLAKALKLPLGGELRRVRNTPPQVSLPASRRRQNIRGAFRVEQHRMIEGCRVLLVDDVTTTGATASEAARTLLEAGAAGVSLVHLQDQVSADAPVADLWVDAKGNLIQMRTADGLVMQRIDAKQAAAAFAQDVADIDQLEKKAR